MASPHENKSSACSGRRGTAAGATVVAALFACAFSGTALAQAAGSITLRGGATQIAPDVTSGDLSAPSFPGTKADVKSDTQPTAGITWMLNDQVAIDLPLAAGFKHDIVGDGAIAGVGKVAETRVLPVTLLAQYRFFGASSALRPYVGIGPTYARFYKERSTAALTALTGGSPANPTTLSLESRWGATVQAGLAARLTGNWGLDASVAKTMVKTKATLSTGQTQDIKLDPWSYSLGVSYRF
ncbi:MAG: OmpW family protein [Rubrivivax sp.]|nr:OmpW family protein [Rubrivivax sp.]